MLKRLPGLLIFLSISLFATSCGLFMDVSINPEQPQDQTSSNANLSALQVMAGTTSLLNNFNSGTTSYNIAVANSVISVTVIPTASDGEATIKVNNVSVTSGHSSGSINLIEGTNTVSITVKAQDGTTNIYTIVVTRQYIKANLSNLVISSCHLSPAFDQYITSYVVYTRNINSVTVTPTVTQAGATITVNGTAVNSGQPSSAITLNTGNHPANITTITVHVTSADLTLEKDYTLKIYYFDSDPELVGHWQLNSNINDSSSNPYDTLWRCYLALEGNTVHYTTPEFVTEGIRTGLHFRHAAIGFQIIDDQLLDGDLNPLSENFSGEWLDCEKDSIYPGLNSKLNISDYVTVSFWFFWDTDLMLDYMGNTVSESAALDGNYYIIMNITSKSVFWNHGWQVRFEQTASESIVYLYLHHNGSYDKLPIVENFSSYRGSWVNITITIDNMNREVITYVNGIATNASPQTYTASYTRIPDNLTESQDPNYTGHFAIGAFSHPWGGFTVNGKMSDEQVYHGLIDANEAYNIYQYGGLTAP